MTTAVDQLTASLTGRYTIERELGRGGMATVYLAHDVRHDRKVALKMLHPELGLAVGPERFLREIQVTAQLHHPHILTLHDSGEAGGLLYYVMPYVDGESLRGRLVRERQLPVDDAIRIACDVADALDYAHRHNVLHRDIKPENVLLHDGRAMVADFGIARAVVRASEPDTQTASGVSIGTPAYMSPEQAAGERELDARTDIHALGVVLYEMLAGEPPYRAPTAQGVIARLMSEEARPLSQVRRTLPPHVEAAVRKALAKLPADRFATAREFANALGQPAWISMPAEPVTTSAMRPPTRQVTVSLPTVTVRAVAPWLLAAAGMALAAWATWLRPTGPPPPPVRARFELVVPDSMRLRSGLARGTVAFSPDGSRLVYVGGRGQLYSRAINELDANPLPGTEGALNPQFSPDGRWLVFETESQLRKISVAGGSVVTIADQATRASWGDNDVVVFNRPGGGGLYRVSPAGGRAEPISQPDTAAGEVRHTWAAVLPGGRSVLFEIGLRGDSSVLAAMRLDDRRVVRLGVAGTNPRYVSSGHVLFGSISEGTVSAVPFDLDRLAVTGPAVTVLEGVRVKSGGSTQITVSPNGNLAYVEGAVSSQLVLVDHSGNERPLLAASHSRRLRSPRLSPNGALIAVTARETNGRTDIWIYNIASRTLSRFTTDGRSSDATWTADGRRLVWRVTDDQGRPTLWWQPSDGSGTPEPLYRSVPNATRATFARTGEFFVAQVRSDSTNSDLVLVPLTGDPTPRVLVSTRENDVEPSVSPDGRWVAYMSAGRTGFDVYVQQTSAAGGRRQVSQDGGRLPVWSSDGRTLYYRVPNRIVAAKLVLQPEFAVMTRDTLFEDTYMVGPYTTLELTPDGRQFLMMEEGSARDRVVVVLGWLDELRERMTMAAKK
jgi:serine/threonine-protein kinase